MSGRGVNVWGEVVAGDMSPPVGCSWAWGIPWDVGLGIFLERHSMNLICVLCLCLYGIMRWSHFYNLKATLCLGSLRCK